MTRHECRGWLPPARVMEVISSKYNAWQACLIAPGGYRLSYVSSVGFCAIKPAACTHQLRVGRELTLCKGMAVCDKGDHDHVCSMTVVAGSST
jgi:hypothetical protein